MKIVANYIYIFIFDKEIRNNLEQIPTRPLS
jgi:hypothetical protein